MTDIEIAALLHCVIEFSAYLGFCIVVKIYHDVTADDKVEFLFESEIIHKIVVAKLNILPYWIADLPEILCV